MVPDPSFEVAVNDDAEYGDRLVVGVSIPALAGLTAADYLVDRLDAERIGHVTASGLPSLAPFENGRPRPHTRLYGAPDADLTVLVGELFVPVGAAEAYADGILAWAGAAGVEEVTLLAGVPYPHAPEEHAVYFVATDEYRERRLADGDLTALGGGFLDGIHGELLSRAAEGTAPPTGALVTPSHPPGPDLEAALLFVDALEETHGIDVDTEKLKQLSADVKRHYEEMAKRLEAMSEGSTAMDGRDYPEDRAYM